MKIAVIGMGAAGGAAARFAALAGHEVTGFEQFTIGHENGSSHGESRIVRYTYPDPFYSALMAEAFPLWGALEREAGEEFLVRNGCLFLGPCAHPEMVAIARALAEAGRAFETLGPEAARERFPALRLRGGEEAVFQSEGGFIRAGATVTATARLAREAGATLLEETRVLEIEERRGSVVVRVSGTHDATGEHAEAGTIEQGHATSTSAPADTREFVFDAAVVTTGAWAGKLLAGAGLPLRVTRQQIVHLAIARNAELFDPARLPVWIDAASYDYGFPSDGRLPGVKLALHRPGDTVDPDAVRRDVDDAFVRERAAYAAFRLPDLEPTPVHAKVCLYTTTPDEDFIVDRAPGTSRVWLTSACSGHGFKFAILIGKIAASLATTGSPSSPNDPSAPFFSHALDRFALSRFRRSS